MNTLKRYFVAESSFFKAVPALVWQLLFFYLPVLFIIALSFVYLPSRTLTFQYYSALLNSVYLGIIIRSLLLATGTVTLCLLVGYPIAYFLALRVRRFKTLLFFLMIVPFWTNLLVLAYAWFFLLDRDGLINSILLLLGIIDKPISMLNSTFATFLVMFYCYLPFMIMPLYSILEKFDVTLIEASKDLGATHWQTFFNIILPMSYPGIQTGFLVVFVPAFGEFAIPYLVGGDRQMYVGTLITHLFLIADKAAAGSAFTLLSCVVLLSIVVVVYRLLQRSSRT
jgi:spermidine/putrescine transport system permease protein